MIARIWRGATRASDADAYVEYLERTGMAGYRDTPGNLGAYALRRVTGDRAEFTTISLWDSKESIERFAGADVEAAVFYPEDDRFLIERELRVSHFEVVQAMPGKTGSSRNG
jgi:heme-degrading monooxygenase HmoA